VRLDHLLSKEYMSLDRGLHDRIDVQLKSTTDEAIENAPFPSRNGAAKGPIAHLERMVGGRGRNGYRHHSSCAAPAMGVYLPSYTASSACHASDASSLTNAIGTALFSFEGTTLAASSTHRVDSLRSPLSRPRPFALVWRFQGEIVTERSGRRSASMRRRRRWRDP
jgi:hypothetical protein